MLGVKVGVAYDLFGVNAASQFCVTIPVYLVTLQHIIYPFPLICVAT